MLVKVLVGDRPGCPWTKLGGPSTAERRDAYMQWWATTETQLCTREGEKG